MQLVGCKSANMPQNNADGGGEQPDALRAVRLICHLSRNAW